MKELKWFNMVYNDINYGEWYKITKNGEIKNIKTNNIIKTHKGNRGYIVLKIKIGNKGFAFLIHRALACTFIPNPENKKQVNHIDGNKLNNNLNNLEWCTPKENTRHAFDNGLCIGNTGNNFTDEEIIQIKSDYERLKNYRKVAKIWNVTHPTIIKYVKME